MLYKHKRLKIKGPSHNMEKRFGDFTKNVKIFKADFKEI